MKVAAAIRSLYDELSTSHSTLKEAVDEILTNKKNERWHYFSRIKDIQSYAQKLETGRINDPKNLEDFFACTLVVENQSCIPKAEELISDNFTLVERRPKSFEVTPHKPSSFEFDDLRLYCQFTQSHNGQWVTANGLKFEVQIKTFLSHAWSIATHDLIYKGDRIDWMASRVAYQIKAMLEHADSSIASVREIGELSKAKKEDRKTAERREMVEWIKMTWETMQLPIDVLRLADTLITLSHATGVKQDRLRSLIDKATMEGRGAKSLNLSPYSTVVKELLSMPSVVDGLINRRSDNKTRLFVTEEMEVEQQSTEVEELLIRV